jgi:hypothetical protein
MIGLGVAFQLHSRISFHSFHIAAQSQRSSFPSVCTLTWHSQPRSLGKRDGLLPDLKFGCLSVSARCSSQTLASLPSNPPLTDCITAAALVSVVDRGQNSLSGSQTLGNIYPGQPFLKAPAPQSLEAINVEQEAARFSATLGFHSPYPFVDVAHVENVPSGKVALDNIGVSMSKRRALTAARRSVMPPPGVDREHSDDARHENSDESDHFSEFHPSSAYPALLTADASTLFG